MALPQISDSEWEVMTVLWARAPQGAQEVIAALAGRRRWNSRTVRTFLNRLVKKGAVSYVAEGNRYLYRPAVSREQCIREESRSFVSRVFAGNAGAMLVQFVQQARLSAEEIRQLRKALEEKGKE
jgi:BlaI family transcriptional regulator, penicillinase repressor